MRHHLFPLPLLLTLGCLEEDFDGDGFGVSVDCDDHRNTVHPDMADTCNGIDDNCDGVIDENATSGDPGAYLLWVDYDGDGFGADGSERYTCAEAYTQYGWATQGGDCNDAAYRWAPGNAPQCGGDFNCDGQDDGDCADYVPSANEPWLITSADAMAYLTGDVLFRTTWGGLPAIGALDPGGLQVATVDSTTAKLTLVGDGDLVIDNTCAPAAFGDALLVGCSASDAFFVLDVSGDTGRVALPMSAPNVSRGPAGSQLGAAVVVIDAQAQGVPQLAVSAPRDSGGAVLLVEVVGGGSPFLEHGRLLGVSSPSLAATDLDGDSAVDLVIGAPEDGGVWVVPGPLPSGSVFVDQVGIWLQAVDGADGSELQLAGDMDGDGLDEVAVVDPEGGFYLLAGVPAGGSLDAHPHVSAPAGGPVRVRAAGDVNGDGQDDLLLGLPDELRTGVLFGPVTALQTDAHLDRGFKGGDETTSVPPLVGSALIAPGDVNGDGLADFGGSTGGYTYIVYGRNSP